jgi:gamma-tubulin complex component 3
MGVRSRGIDGLIKAERRVYMCLSTGPGGDTGGQGTYLTLRRLQLWLAEPLRRMRLLAALVDAADGCIGGDLAGRVWAASKVGDPVARAYATRLLQQVGMSRNRLRSKRAS